MQPDSDFDTFLRQAWEEHVADAAGVAARLADAGLARVATATQAAALAHLAQHLWGEHLGLWDEGRAWLQRLGEHPACRGEALAAVRRARASLALSAGMGDERAAMPPSERIRVAALAAAQLAGRDTARAAALFQEALAEAEASALDAADPAHRALAVTGNSLACSLEEKAGRSAHERELMILAAQAARRHWALAGTWLETERAEYRLAMSWLQAGDSARVRPHAQECLAIVQAHGAPALERFYAWEAIGVVERAAGNPAGHALALAGAREAHAALDEGDRGGCQTALDRLAA
jgi:hypothetical protein